jgi:hypothetical protein
MEAAQDWQWMVGSDRRLYVFAVKHDRLARAVAESCVKSGLLLGRVDADAGEHSLDHSGHIRVERLPDVRRPKNAVF